MPPKNRGLTDATKGAGSLPGAFELYQAGAYTRSRFSSTSAVSDTHKTPYTPYTPPRPPQHGLHNPYAQPLSHEKRSS